jgi:O-acetyl-ADP-ribose deacetylase (regulator of RNase III)
MKVEIVLGDITELGVDGIVNAANDHLQMGGGVAGAIRRKGGEDIQREANEIGPIEVGEAVVTGAGRLNAKFVIHAATMGLDQETDEEKIRSAAQNAMKRVVEHGMKSVAFPALGTGVGGFSMEKAARIMLEEVGKFKDDPRAPESVLFVLYTPGDLAAFKRGIYGEDKGI